MIVEIVAAMSADGKIAEQADQKSLDWTSKEDLKFFVRKTKEAGVLVMGRKTFETIGKPLKDRLIVVMTREPEKYRGVVSSEKREAGEIEFTNASPGEILEDLKKRRYEKVVIAGGAHVYGEFLRENLVTDLYLTIEPVLFGTGVPLATGFERANLELVDISPMGKQAVLLHYKVK